MKPILFIAAAALAGCASAPQVPSAQELLRNVQDARSPADHEALATRYASLAADARRQAQAHRAMARDPLGVGRGSWTMPAHCRNLAAAFDGRSAEHEAMAFAQRQLAALTRI